MSLIVDCSVALKWALPEDGREAALDLIGSPLAAPDFLKLECANVLAIKARKGLLTSAQAASALEQIETDSNIEFRPTLSYVPHAHRLAMELGQTAYDCLYLAVAIADRAVVVTADLPFAKAVEAHPDYRRFLRRLV